MARRTKEQIEKDEKTKAVVKEQVCRIIEKHWPQLIDGVGAATVNILLPSMTMDKVSVNIRYQKQVNDGVEALADDGQEELPISRPTEPGVTQ